MSTVPSIASGMWHDKDWRYVSGRTASLQYSQCQPALHFSFRRRKKKRKPGFYFESICLSLVVMTLNFSPAYNIKRHLQHVLLNCTFTNAFLFIMMDCRTEDNYNYIYITKKKLSQVCLHIQRFIHRISVLLGLLYKIVI